MSKLSEFRKNARNGHKAVLVVTVNVGDSYIVYMADRDNKKLTDVEPVWVLNDDPNEQTELGEVASSVFGVTLRPGEKKGVYFMTTRCMPERELRLNLKKKKDGEEVEGRVVASTTNEKNGHEYVIEQVDTEILLGGIPRLNSVTAHGTRDKKHAVEEDIFVTSAMRERFDPKKFLAFL